MKHNSIEKYSIVTLIYMAKSRGSIFSKPGNIKPELFDIYDSDGLKTTIRIMLGINELGAELRNFDITNKCDIFRAIEKILNDDDGSERFSTFLDTVERFVTRKYFRELLTSSCVEDGLNYQPLLYKCVRNPGKFAPDFEYLMDKMREYEIKSIEVHNKANDVDLKTYMDDVLDEQWEVDKEMMVQQIENHDATIDARDRERSLSRRRGKKSEASQLYIALNEIMHDRKGKTLDVGTIKGIVDERYTSPPKGKDKKNSKTAERERRKEAWEKRDKERRKRERKMLVKKTRRKGRKGEARAKSRSKSKHNGKAKAKSKSKSRSKSNSKGKAKKGGRRKTKRKTKRKMKRKTRRRVRKKIN